MADLCCELWLLHTTIYTVPVQVTQPGLSTASLDEAEQEVSCCWTRPISKPVMYKSLQRTVQVLLSSMPAGRRRCMHKSVGVTQLHWRQS